MSCDALGHPETDGVAFLLGQAVRTVRPQFPIPLQAVGAATALQPRPLLGTRAEAELAQVVLHKLAGGQAQLLRVYGAVRAGQPVAVHVVVYFAVRGDVHA